MSFLRVIIPDSHGCYIDEGASSALIADMVKLRPSEVVLLGDHIDGGGVFSSHQNNYISDLGYSYETDCFFANCFLDQIQAASPEAEWHYLEGNHEQHVERWLSRTLKSERDADAQLDVISPEKKLYLGKRGIQYYRMADFHHGLTVRGTIKLGHCYFVHGVTASKHATAAHVHKYNACVVHGHTHRAQEFRITTVSAGTIGAWCPGTLMQLQPPYFHTSTSDWSHGYGLQCVDADGTFLHLNIPIINGRSMLTALLDSGVFDHGQRHGEKTKSAVATSKARSTRARRPAVPAVAAKGSRPKARRTGSARNVRRGAARVGRGRNTGATRRATAAHGRLGAK